MKKIKKLLAMIMAMTMVLGMAMTVSAAPGDEKPTYKITVNGLTSDEETTVSAYKVVSYTDEEGGNNSWTVEPWAVAYVNQTGPEWSIDYEGLLESGAYKSATHVATGTAGIGVTSVDLTVSDIGAYLIVATGTHTIYNAMGGVTYKLDESTKYLLVGCDTTVTAKGGDYSVTKTFVDSEGDATTDGFYQRGDTVYFKIETYYPSFNKETVNKTFTVYDEYTGMDITAFEVESVGNITEFTADDVTYNYGPTGSLPTTDGAGTVSVTFSNDFTEKVQAGEKVVISVEAVIKGVDSAPFKNKARTSSAEDPSEVTGDNANLTIIKKDGIGTDAKTLAGAEFSISRSEGSAPIPLVQAKDGEGNPISGVYMIAAAGEENQVTSAAVDENGQLIIKGLDSGTYYITETKAPEGYSINDNIAPVTISADSDNAAQLLDVEVSVVDTKLASLPSTGGIGTTIFTIGGCAIMIAAAALYFVNRRKSEEN